MRSPQGRHKHHYKTRLEDKVPRIVGVEATQGVSQVRAQLGGRLGGRLGSRLDS